MTTTEHNGLTLSQQRRLGILVKEMDSYNDELRKALDYIARSLTKSQEQANRLRRILLEGK